MIRTLFAAMALVGSSGMVPCAPIPDEIKPKAVVKTYDLKPILGDKCATTKMSDADAVVRLILETVKVGDLKPGTSGPQLVIRDGTKLEVTASEKVHGEIKGLVEALERLADLAIDIKTEVIELDPKAAEKLVEALPKPEKGKPQSPVLFGTNNQDEEEVLAEANKVLKTGKVIQACAARYANGIEVGLASRHAIATYSPTLDAGRKPTAPLQCVKDGFALSAFPLVTADRRFVRVKLTEQSTIFHGLKEREIRGFGDAFMETRVSADVSDVGTTGSATVADGGTLLFKLAYAPKDKVWVVVVQPTIFIQAEEDALKQEGKKP
jgi:hypothetical protein